MLSIVALALGQGPALAGPGPDQGPALAGPGPDQGPALAGPGPDQALGGRRKNYAKNQVNVDVTFKNTP